MTTIDATGSAAVCNAVGLHARPAVKLTQLAKAHPGPIEIATSTDGPWIDLKSPVKLMRLKAPRGAVLHVRAGGEAAEAAVAEAIDFIRRGFDEP